MAALGRQRSFNPRLVTHVSRAPLLLKAPTQGQPWMHVGEGTPGGVEAGTEVTWAQRDKGLTRLHNALVWRALVASSTGRGWHEIAFREGKEISTAAGCVAGLGVEKGNSLQHHSWEQFLWVMYPVPGKKWQALCQRHDCRGPGTD